MTTRPDLLSTPDIATWLAAHPEWRREGDCLARDFRFGDFSEAFAFMTRVALLAESANHHPDWSNAWNRVAIRLTSHDAGGLTNKDTRLAEAIDRVVSASPDRPI